MTLKYVDPWAARYPSEDQIKSLQQPATAKNQNSGIVGDFVDAFQQGAYQSAAGDAEAVGQISDSDTFKSIGKALAKGANNQTDTMTVNAKQALSQHIFKDDPDSFTGVAFDDGATNWRTWALQFGVLGGQVAGTVATGFGAGTVVKFGAKQVIKSVAKKAITKEARQLVAKNAVKEAIRNGALDDVRTALIAAPDKAAINAVLNKATSRLGGIATTAVAGSMAAGMRAQQARDEYLSLDADTLNQNPEFQKAYWEIADNTENQGLDTATIHNAAKEMLAEKAATTAFFDKKALLSDFASGAYVPGAGGVIGRGAATTSKMGRFGLGLAQEGATEAWQGGETQRAVNEAIKEWGDESRDPMANVVRTRWEEGTLGGVFGGMAKVVEGQHVAPSKPIVTVEQPALTGNSLLDGALAQSSADEQSRYDTLTGHVDDLSKPSYMRNGEISPTLENAIVQFRLDTLQQQQIQQRQDGIMQPLDNPVTGNPDEPAFLRSRSFNPTGRDLSSAPEVDPNTPVQQALARSASTDNSIESQLSDTIARGDQGKTPQEDFLTGEIVWNDGRAPIPPSGRIEQGMVVDGQANEVLPESRGIGYNGTINAGGASGDGINSAYVPPVTADRVNADRSMGSETIIDPRTPIGQSIAQAGSETDAIFNELKSLRVTRRGKPFGSVKEAQLASRPTETPIALPTGGFGVVDKAELKQAQATQAPSATVTNDGINTLGVNDANASYINQPADSAIKNVLGVKTEKQSNNDGSSTYRFSFNDGHASVLTHSDGTAHIMDVQIGDGETAGLRGKGVGTKLYEHIGNELAKDGVILESTRWSKHRSAISPAALRVWEKLEKAGMATVVGNENARVLDRFSGVNEVRDIPIYEFTGNKSSTNQSTVNQHGVNEIASSPVVAQNQPNINVNGSNNGQTTVKQNKDGIAVDQNEREDGKTELLSNGLRLFHGSSNADLTLDDIQIVRSNQKQGKKGRSYGGFYGSVEDDISNAERYANMSGNPGTMYEANIAPGTKVLHKVGDVTRLSERYIDELRSQGYGLVVGRDPTGRHTEYAVIDKSAISGFGKKGEVKSQSTATITNDGTKSENIPDSILSAFPDMQVSNEGYLGLNPFTLSEREALKNAGLVQEVKSADGSSYLAVDPEKLWDLRKTRSEELNNTKTEISQEERNRAIENRASSYDRLANEQDELGDLGDKELAAKYRAKAEEIRQRKSTSQPIADQAVGTSSPDTVTPPVVATDSQSTPAPANAEQISEADLKDLDLLKEHAGKWKYRYAVGANWQTASTKESALERARGAHQKAIANGDPLPTKAERYSTSEAAQAAQMEQRYGKISIPELEKEHARLGSVVADLQQTGKNEFNGNGGRRTGAATANEGARGAGLEKMRLESYIKARKERESATGNKENFIANPPEQAASKPGKTIQDHFDDLNKFHRGDLNFDEFKQASSDFLDNEEAVKAKLSSLTKPEILKRMGAMFNYNHKGDKKDVIVDAAYQSLAGQLRFAAHGDKDVITETVSFEEIQGNRARKTTASKARDELSTLTPEQYGIYQEKAKVNTKKAEERFQKVKQQISDPQTLDDFETFLNYRSSDKLTPEQKARYEDLKAERNLDKRDQEAAAAKETKVVPTATGDIVKTKHTKEGHDLFVVKLADRVDRDAYISINAKAKELGGYYSKFRGNGAVPGFQFRSEEQAQEFQQWLSNTGNETSSGIDLKATTDITAEPEVSTEESSKKKQAAKLRDRAASVREKAQAELNAERKANTVKRARETAYAVARAEADLRFANILDAIANGIEAGEIKYLRNMTAGTQLETLDTVLRRIVRSNKMSQAIRDDLIQKGYLRKGDDAELSWTDSAPIEVITQYAEMPGMDYWANILRDTAKNMQTTTGFKQAGVKIMNQVLIAINAENRMVTISDPELIDKLKQFSKQHEVRDYLKDTMADYDRLVRMGITSPVELRAALRELHKVKQSLKTDRPKRDPVKQKEDALKMRLLNNRNSFIDFFPTPEDHANDVIARAGIEPGMRVLEPSAGHGTLAVAARDAGATVDAVELAGDLRDILSEKGFNLVGSDFMETEPAGEYDAVVMNPPFSNDMDIDHVKHAYAHLKPGGRLVAIVSSMAGERSNNKNKQFKEWLNGLGATEEMMPEGSFKNSMNPTSVRTKIIELQKPSDSENVKSQPIGSRVTIHTPKGKPVEVQYQLVSAADLVASNEFDGRINKEYPQELQPRDRTKASYQQQVNQIASNPEGSRLAGSPESDRGAPIVRDLVVESGNGRTIGIKQAYKQGTATEYRDYLIKHADEFGFTADDVSVFDDPVLVRQRVSELSPEERLDFVVDSNMDAKMAKSATEDAKSDARYLDEGLMGLLNIPEGGDLLAASNEGFLSAFAHKLGVNSLNSYKDSAGRWNDAYRKRVSNAIFAYGYDNDTLLKAATGDTSEAGKNLTNALMNNATNVAELRSMSPDAAKAFVNYLAEGIDVMTSAKRNGQSIQEVVNQGDMLSGGVSHYGGAIAEMLADASRSGKRLTEMLNQITGMLNESAKAADQIDLLTGEPTQQVTAEEAINAAEKDFNERKQQEQRVRPSQDLFGANSARIGDNNGSGTSVSRPVSASETKSAGENSRLNIADVIQDKMSVADLVNWIASHSQNKTYSAIANRILSHIPNDIDVMVVSAGSKLRKAIPSSMNISNGMYWTKGDEKTLILKDHSFGENGLNEETALHELIHAATSAAIKKGNLVRATTETPELSAAVADLYALQKAVVKYLNDTKADIGITKALAASDVKELVAWGMTNKDFQNILQDIPYDKESAWNKFVSLVAKLLGIKQTDKTALGELIRVTDNILSAKESGTVNTLSPDKGKAAQFSKMPLNAAEKSGKGMTKPEATLAAKEWLKQFKTDINVRVVKDQAEFKKALADLGQPDALQEGEVANAAYLPDSQTLLLNASAIQNPARLRQLMRHEILGHHGLEYVIGKGAVNDIRQILKNGYNTSKAIRDAVDAVAANYAGADSDTKTKEAFAHYAENRPVDQGALGRLWDRVVSAVKSALVKAGFIRANEAEQQLDSLLQTIAEHMRQGRTNNDPNGGPGNKTYFSKNKNGDTSAYGQAESLLKESGSSLVNWLKQQRGWGLGTLTDLQIDQIYRDITGGAVNRYQKLRAKMEADRNDILLKAETEVDPLWDAMPTAEKAAMSNLMHDATMAKLHPDKSLEENSLYQEVKEKLARAKTEKTKAEYQAELDTIKDNHRNLSERYRLTSKQGKELYQTMRKVYDDQWSELRDAIEQRIKDVMGEGGKALAAQMRLKMEQALKHGPYFPLARFGDYIIRAKKGDQYFREHFEKRRDAEAALKQYRKEGFTANLSVKEQGSGDQANMHALGMDIMEALDKAQAEGTAPSELKDTVWQAMLEMLPDASFAKHAIHRKRTKGASRDGHRAYLNSVYHYAHHVSKIKYGHKMKAELDGMKEQVKAAERNEESSIKADDIEVAQQVLNEMNKRHELNMNPKGSALSGKLGNLGFMFYLGASPAAAVINLTQNFMVMLPQLAGKFGVMKASSFMLKAMGDYIKHGVFKSGTKEAWVSLTRAKSGITADEKAMLNALYHAGALDLTQAHSIAARADTDLQDAKHSAKWVRTGMQWAGSLFHNAEVLNREVAALTAYRLLKEKNPKINMDEAVDQVTEMVYDGHGNYAASNRPRFMRNDVAKVLTQFKIYSQMMTYTMISNAIKAAKGDKAALKTLGVMTGTTFMMAGMMGMPTPITLLLYGIAAAIDDDDDRSWEASFRLGLSEVLGPELGELVANGPLDQATNLNISGRVGMNNLWWRDPKEGTEGDDLTFHYVQQIAGPVLGIGVSAVRGMREFANGDIQRGVEAMSPKAVKDLAKAYRQASEGEKTRNGDSVIDDVGAWNVAMQAMGFSSAQMEKVYSAREYIKGKEKIIEDRRSNLLADYFTAMREQDTDAMQDVMDNIREFNASHNKAEAITGKILKQSMKSRERSGERTQAGTYLSSKREYLRSEGAFLKQE